MRRCDRLRRRVGRAPRRKSRSYPLAGEHMPEVAPPEQHKQSPIASVSEVVRAWNSLGNIRAFDGEVEEIVLKRRAVAWRFNPFGPGEHSVIAKRCGRATATVEHLVYSQILPQSGLDALKCFGMVDATTDGECWLFVEDAGGIDFSLSTPGHSEL